MESKFTFKEVDQEGLETLDAIANANKFNKWMFDTIRPWCKGSVLEVGSGIGNISRNFLNSGWDIVLSDIRNNYIEYLHQEFSGQPSLKGIVHMDLVHPEFAKVYEECLGKFDTVFALNVVEHIENDGLALRNIKLLLREGGHVVILVPAYQTLYNRFDVELEHYRRYNKSTLNNLIKSNGYNQAHSQYFNAMGILGWFISGKIQKNKTIPKSQMSLYDKMVPLFKVIDKGLLNRIGLSVISVGRK
jgi:2-polyprenyl-3-methyl-5-hydroxy-6-metoxy-1,4-benzoquinol methylase